MRAAALAQLERTEEAAKAAEVLLSHYPGLTVERHLKNFRWKMAADTAHYRDGLLKAGIPLRNLTLVEFLQRSAGMGLALGRGFAGSKSAASAIFVSSVDRIWFRQNAGAS